MDLEEKRQWEEERDWGMRNKSERRKGIGRRKGTGLTTLTAQCTALRCSENSSLQYIDCFCANTGTAL